MPTGHSSEPRRLAGALAAGLLIVVGGSGCSTGEIVHGAPAPDGGSARDASAPGASIDGGRVPPDGGAPAPDGGAPTPDGGAPTPDGGAPAPDGGAPAPDGPGPPADSGTPQPDAGPPPPDGGASEAWWRSTFVGGRSRYMHRPWNVGFSFYTGQAHLNWQTYMGAWPDTIMGGLTGDDRQTTWTGLCGGSPTDPVTPVPTKTVPHVKSSYHVNAWTCDTCPRDVWAILGLPTVPQNWKPAGRTYLDGWKDVADGLYDDWYFKMGQRMRAHLEEIDRDHTKVVLRPNWELNQDTAFRPNFWKNGGWVKLYNQMMKRFAENFRAGFGYRVPLILAAVEGTQGCMRVEPDGACNEGTLDSFLADDGAGLYDLVEVSCHPSVWNAQTEAQMHLWMEGPMPPSTDPAKSNNFACEDAFRVAERHDLAAALTEWSPRNEVEYYTPLAAEAVDVIADLLERHQDILAFTNAFHVSFVNEGYNPTGDASFGVVWRHAVQRHKARFAALP